MPEPKSRRAMVLAPAPDLTVTVERFDDEEEIHLHAGGQGYWVARMLHVLGVETALCGSFGGETGQVVRHLIEDLGVRVVPTSVGGANGGYVHDRRDGDRAEVGVQQARRLTRHELDDFYSAALAEGLDSDLCVLGGPALEAPAVPADLYERLARDLRASGCTVVADLSGEPRQAALEGGLDLLKTSEEDLVEDGWLAPNPTDDDMVEVLHRLSRTGGGAERVIVTRGGTHPAMVLDHEEVLTVSAPSVDAVDTKGAGDSVTAGVAAGLVAGRPFRGALKLGFAAATLNVARHGLASGEAAAIEKTTGSVAVHVHETAKAS